MAARHSIDVNITGGSVTADEPTAVTEVGFSVTATVGGATLPAQACHRVTLQNRLTADDGTTPQTESVWVLIGGVKLFELLNGVSVTVNVTNANLVSVRSFASTSLVSGAITP